MSGPSGVGLGGECNVFTDFSGAMPENPEGKEGRLALSGRQGDTVISLICEKGNAACYVVEQISATFYSAHQRRKGKGGGGEKRSHRRIAPNGKFKGERGKKLVANGYTEKGPSHCSATREKGGKGWCLPAWFSLSQKKNLMTHAVGEGEKKKKGAFLAAGQTWGGGHLWAKQGGGSVDQRKKVKKRGEVKKG